MESNFELAGTELNASLRDMLNLVDRITICRVQSTRSIAHGTVVSELTFTIQETGDYFVIGTSTGMLWITINGTEVVDSSAPNYFTLNTNSPIGKKIIHFTAGEVVSFKDCAGPGNRTLTVGDFVLALKV